MGVREAPRRPGIEASRGKRARLCARRALACAGEFLARPCALECARKGGPGRPGIDAFEAAMLREDRQRGFYIAFSYCADAQRECSAFHKRTGRIVKRLTVQEILDEEFVQTL